MGPLRGLYGGLVAQGLEALGVRGFACEHEEFQRKILGGLATRRGVRVCPHCVEAKMFSRLLPLSSIQSSEIILRSTRKQLSTGVSFSSDGRPYTPYYRKRESE